MPYYIVQRKMVVREDVIVKADDKHGAFLKAGEDIKCKVISEQDVDYEPDYNSIHEIAYVSETTRLEIEE